MESAGEIISDSALPILKNIMTLRYHPYSISPISRLSPADFEVKRNLSIGQIENEIIKEIETLIGAENKIVMPMSSGVDSRLLLTLLREIRPELPVNCVCIGFNHPADENEEARRVAEYYNCNFHSIFLDDIIRELPLLIYLIGEPRWNLYHYYLFKEARKHASVMMTGDGGDEVFAGYTFRYKKFLSLIYGHESSPYHMIEAYLNCHERDWVPDQEKMFGPMMKFSWSDIYEMFYPTFASPLNPLDMVLLSDFNGKLRNDFTRSSLEFSKHFGIKLVSPLLSKNIISCGIQLPSISKYDARLDLGKLPLRKIIEKHDSGMPLMTRKQGFSADPSYIWKKYAKERFAALFDNSNVINAGLINGDWILSATRKADEGDMRYTNKLLSILCLEVWYRLFISCEMRPSHLL